MKTVKPTTIRVEPIEGEPGRFHVQSHSERTEPHLCDVLAINQNGECSCTDFKIKCRNNIRDQILFQGFFTSQPYLILGRKTPNPKRTICKHLHVTRWKWYEITTTKIAHRLGTPRSGWITRLKNQYENTVERANDSRR